MTIRGIIYRVHRFVHSIALPIVLNYNFKKNARPLQTASLDKVLIIAPHPDDETFGCGMLIKELCESGKRVHVIIMSKGEAALSESIVCREELIAVRNQLAHKATKLLNLPKEQLIILNFPDSKFKAAPIEHVNELRECITRINPEYIFSPHPWEHSNDHTAAVKILNEVLKSTTAIRYFFCVWFYDHMPARTALKLDFSKTVYFEGDIDTKRKCIDIYTGAKTPSGHYYSCKLPRLMLNGVSNKREYFFEDFGLNTPF